MTPQEFKAWFDGFTESMDKLPSKKQWERIKERVAEIDNSSVTYHRFYDYYWRPTYWTYYCNGAPLATTLNCSVGGGTKSEVGISGSGFNSASAMYALGKADSLSLTAPPVSA